MSLGFPRHNMIVVTVLGMTVGISSLIGCQTTNKRTAQNDPTDSAAGKLPRLETSALPGAESMTSSDPSKEQKASVQMVVAASFEKSNEPERAIPVYLDVIHKDPRRADAYHRLAVLHDRTGKHKEALDSYREAIARDPANPDIHCDLGYSLYLARQWPEAEASLRQAIALKSDHTRAHNNLGLLLARTGGYDEALAEFARAGCTEAEARANLAHAMMLQERWTDAQEQCDLAMRSPTASKEVRARLQRLHDAMARAQSASQSSAQTSAQAAAVAPRG